MRKIVLGLGTALLLGARFLLSRTGNVAQDDIRDPVTGLLTQGFIEEVYHAEMKRSTRTGVPFSLLMVEPDGYPNLTKAHGRRGAERVIAAMGEFLQRSLRASDYAGRYGRSRFVVILPETWSDDLTSIVLRLRQPIACKLPGGREDLVINARVGAATWEPGVADLMSVAESKLDQGTVPSN